MATTSQAGPPKEPNPDPSATPTQLPCPDPSAHHVKDKRLQDHASTAALYATHPERAPKVNPLGPDGKLSSASAAQSLKYAKPHELPSHPIVGIDTANSAGSAALLAHGNKTKIEWWKPDGTSDSAAKAALIAKDYKMAPMWQPELSAAGSKAALLAHRDGGKLDLWMPEASAEGNSAAGIALRNKTLSPQLDYGYTSTGKKNALTAATGAMAGGRKRAGSTPAPAVPDYPDAANSAHNSLNAATVAHQPSMRASNHPNRMSSAALESARITHAGANVPREMYGAAPPVALEVEEKRRQDALRASAISMAKKMYDTQQTHINAAAAGPSDGQTGARTAHARQPSTASTVDVKQQAMQYISLQEQAQKLAAERLAKLDPDEAAVFRSYYGYGDKTHRSRLSVRRNRGRASSEGRDAVDSDDEEHSRRIRSQMSQFNNQLAAVDARKRQKDRESLLAAAERKVHAQMHTMDERVFMETGKVSPAMMEEWEARARAKAAEDSEARLANHGKIHVGGGKFLDQSEIDAIAQARMQPTLDEIAEKAALQRARDEELRLDAEEKKRVANVEKERDADLKAETKRQKSEEKAAEKARKAEEKAAHKTEKEAEKSRREEEKRLSKQEKRRSRGAAPLPTTKDTATTLHDGSGAGASPTSPSQKESGFKSLFSRLKRRSRAGSDLSTGSAASGTEKEKEGERRGRHSFLGRRSGESQSEGAGLEAGKAESRAGVGGAPTTTTTTTTSGHTTSGAPPQTTQRGRSPSISSLSDSGEEPMTTTTTAAEAQARGRPRAHRRTSAVSSEDEDEGEDAFEEARDGFDEGGLERPPGFAARETGETGETGSPVRSTRFKEGF
ncbi:hypothetical protein K490DRAFT_49881 [Saccharata proteae CBS 121410]|uniref:Eisosome protein 1 n=1 Tax=Saccharata proteae CBS 121410 TaxID=1314787 RepID=A0A9P4HQI9_9PEZI|nr:hypothetical protein K490DRAFT_49881 [Saccharata proteae CBS 121410]